ncbi:MAG: AAA family ATPase [Anaerolineae bacterium]|nr:AAA family ATPase [Anaerolineae bacterium]
MTAVEEALRYLEARGYLVNGNGAHLNGAGERWELLTLETALAEREPLQQVITGFVRPGLVVVYGPPGALKSLLLADLALCVAAGKAWLQPAPGESCAAIPVQQCPVLWLDFDNGARRTLDRFAALARGHGVTDAPLGIYSMPTPRLNASAPNSITSLAQRVKDFGAGLVIVDNLGVIAGTDENSPDMTTAMSNLRWLAEETGACIVLIHHQRKSNGVVTRVGETLRGHSSIEAALDLALLTERESGSNFVHVRATKSRDVPIRPFGAQWSYEHKAGTTELHTARFWGITAEGGNEDADIAHVILSKVEDGITQTALVKAVREELQDVGEKRIRAILADMVRRGELVQGKGKRNAVCYSLP